VIYAKSSFDLRRKNSAEALFESEDEEIYTPYDLPEIKMAAMKEYSEEVGRGEKLDTASQAMQIPQSDPMQQLEESSQQLSGSNSVQDNASPCEETTQSLFDSPVASAIYVEDLKTISDIFDKDIFDTINSVDHIQRTE